MMIFFTIALVAFLYVVIMSLGGHAHDFVAGDAGHDGETGDSDHITSIFSTKVIATFLMGFGGAGGVARFYGCSYPVACLIGVGVGVAVGFLMVCILRFFANSQANSLVSTRALAGSLGTVEVAIENGQAGQVAVSYGERYNTYTARTRGGTNIAKGRQVRVVDTTGSDLTVEEVA
jgi:membrane protein implicated in regulation of membrane protease activity